MNDERAQPPDGEAEAAASAPPVPPEAESTAPVEDPAVPDAEAAAERTAALEAEPAPEPDSTDEPAAVAAAGTADKQVAAGREPEPAAVADPAPAAAADPVEAPRAPSPGAPGAPSPGAPGAPGAPGGGGDQIEWQPVVTGDTIEWQPVMSGGGDQPDVGRPEVDPPRLGEPAFTEPEFDEQAWEEALAAGHDDDIGHNGVDTGGGGRPGVAAHPAGAVRKAPPRQRPPRQDGETPTEPARGQGAPVNKAKRQVVILSALTAFVVLVAVVGFILSRGATSKGTGAIGSSATPTSVRPSTGGTTVPPANLATYRDDQIGFSIKYPKVWNRLHPPVADIRVVLVAGDGDAVSVRVLPIQTVATQENIGNFKAVTDAVVFGDQNNKLIQEQLVLLNGKLCYYYLYTFKDKDTGQQGLHAHYFVFEGLRILSLVFQSLPADDFTRQAAVYDQVAESFTVDPAPPGATAVPAPTTTVK